MTIFLFLQILFDVCLVATIAIAWRFGGRSERWGALIVTVGTIATFLLTDPVLFDWRTHRGALIAVDVVALAALLLLCLRSTRFWPIWATAFHLIALASHGSIYILPTALLQVYVLFQGFWIYPVMLCIVIGSMGHRARRRGRGNGI